MSGFFEKKLSVFNLVMINVIAIDSLRTLPISAEYGAALVFFYCIAGFFFFMPVALVTAELATTWPNNGGAYIWIKTAFGSRMGFLSIWLMWIYNIVWYPLIFSFIAGAVAYLIDPSLALNKNYMIVTVISAFWIITLLNCFGLKASNILSTLGAIFGTIMPMLLISVLGLSWLVMGKPIQFPWEIHSFLPKQIDFNNLGYFTGIIFGLMGLEMSAIHAGDVANPKKSFPKALLWSTLIILVTLIFSSLSIAMVVPNIKLDVVTGFIDAFKIFLQAYHLQSAINLVVISIVIGSLAGAGAWMLGPSRALSLALNNTYLPAWCHKTNGYDAPVAVLLCQGIISTVLSISFLLLPTVESAYWFLSALSAQLALMFYFLLFLAAICLRYQHNPAPRAFKIPFGNLGIIVIAGMGLLTCFVGIVIGFILPSNIQTLKPTVFAELILAGLIVLSLPVMMLRFRTRD